MNFLENGSVLIAEQIARAIAGGNRELTLTGAYEIASAIRLPSNFTLILSNCHLRMADGVYDNMFVNEHHGTELGRTVDGTDRNIKILGRGKAILDGGTYNGLSEKTSETNGLPHISKNNLLLFTNVEGFEIGHIACHNQRWWALNFVYARNGHLHDIHFQSNDTCIDENGNIYHCMKRDTYKDVLVKNSDGIDLRQGCHDILIERLSGFTEDDTVALTNLNGKTEQWYGVPELTRDICNITIKHVHAAAYCSIIRLLNQGALKLHDIIIEDVQDTSLTCPSLDHGRYALRVGDANHLYGDRHSTAEETYNISINGVNGRGLAVLHLAGEIGNLTLENIEALEERTVLIEDYRTK